MLPLTHARPYTTVLTWPDAFQATVRPALRASPHNIEPVTENITNVHRVTHGNRRANSGLVIASGRG